MRNIEEDGYPIFNKDEWKAQPGAQAGALILDSINKEKSGNGRTYWNCHCLKCGNPLTIKRQDNLRAGAIGGIIYPSGRRYNGTRSCGCKQNIHFKEANRQGLIESKYIDQNYAGLKILYTTDFKDWLSNGSKVIMCECPLCGKPFPTTSRSTSTNCGCKKGLAPISLENFIIKHKCRSKGEQKIYDLLNSVNVPFVMEKKFTECRDKTSLPFDFYLESPNFGKYVIEYDGAQHFKNIEYFGDFNERHKHDLIKNKFCWENNIKIIRIPFNAEFELNDLSLATTRFLLTPENETEYYSSRG